MGRSSHDISEGLRHYLSARHGDVTVSEVRRPNDGLSSETYLVRAAWEGETHDVVARVAPERGLFPIYDLALQARLQREVPVPTAAVIALVEDRSWLGRPFLLMERVAGRVPSDNPHFSAEGWLHDADPSVQRTVFTAFLDVLADIHRAPVVDLPTHDLAYWAEHLAWATDGSPPVAMTAALDWCAAHQPAPAPPPSILWGDVRLGNVLFTEDGAVAAVLDWEMAAVGPAEIDLGWFFALRPRAPSLELPGFLPREEALARYSARLGREIGDLTWYENFALLRSTSILIRTQRLLIEEGHADHWLVGFDPIPRRLYRLAAG